MSTQAIFDHTIYVRASEETAWQQVKLLALQHGQITLERDHLLIATSTEQGSHVYYIIPSSDNQVGLRHLVVPDADIAGILQEVPDITAALDGLSIYVPDSADPAAKKRIRNLAEKIEAVISVSQAYSTDTDVPMPALPLATLPARLYASLFDLIVVVLILSLILDAFPKANSPGVFVLLTFVVGLLYQWYFLIRHNGQTPGKSLRAIRVIRSDGRPITGATVLLRYIGYYLNSLILGLGWLRALTHRDRRGWHDVMAGTHVVFQLSNVEAVKYKRAFTYPAPRLTWILIAINAIIFLTVADNNWAMNNHALVLDEGQYYRLLTSMFFHLDWLHIGLNMWALVMFGSFVERAYGHVRYAVIYFLGGIAGSLASILLNEIYMFALGSSGAIFAVLGAALIYVRRNQKVLGYYGTVSTRNIRYIIAANLIFGFAYPMVDNWAHLGGLVGGMVISNWFAPLLNKTSDPFNSDSILITLINRGPVRILAGFTLLAIVLLGSNAYSSVGQQSRFVGNDITLTYPSTWLVITSSYAAENPEFCDQVDLQCIMQLQQNPSLWVNIFRISTFEVQEWTVEKFEKYEWDYSWSQQPDVKLISRRLIRVDNRDAIERMFAIGDQIHRMVLVKDRDSILYIFAIGSSSDFERYHDELDAIITSLRFTES